MNEFKDPRLEALLAELAKTRHDLERSRMAEEDTRSASMKAFDALQRRQDEIREERRREERRREENRRFWEIGMRAGEQPLGSNISNPSCRKFKTTEIVVCIYVRS